MRITKELASSVAKSLLKKKQEEIQKLENKLKEYVYDKALKFVPKEVSEFNEKFPGYIELSRSVSFQQGWFEYRFKSFRFPDEKSLPLKSEYIDFERSIIEQIASKQDQIAKLQSEYREAIRDVENAIFNLRTVANVKKELPEATPFLPKPGQTTAVSVRLDKIRDLIK